MMLNPTTSEKIDAVALHGEQNKHLLPTYSFFFFFASPLRTYPTKLASKEEGILTFGVVTQERWVGLWPSPVCSLCPSLPSPKKLHLCKNETCPKGKEEKKIWKGRCSVVTINQKGLQSSNQSSCLAHLRCTKYYGVISNKAILLHKHTPPWIWTLQCQTSIKHPSHLSISKHPSIHPILYPIPTYIYLVVGYHGYERSLWWMKGKKASIQFLHVCMHTSGRRQRDREWQGVIPSSPGWVFCLWEHEQQLWPSSVGLHMPTSKPLLQLCSTSDGPGTAGCYYKCLQQHVSSIAHQTKPNQESLTETSPFCTIGTSMYPLDVWRLQWTTTWILHFACQQPTRCCTDSHQFTTADSGSAAPTLTNYAYNTQTDNTGKTG